MHHLLGGWGLGAEAQPTSVAAQTSNHGKWVPKRALSTRWIQIIAAAYPTA